MTEALADGDQQLRDVPSAAHRLGTRCRFLFGRDISIDDLERSWSGELEAADRGLIDNRL
jgi:hypothetical protein